jgi:hypothetical protein
MDATGQSVQKKKEGPQIIVSTMAVEKKRLERQVWCYDADRTSSCRFDPLVRMYPVLQRQHLLYVTSQKQFSLSLSINVVSIVPFYDCRKKLKTISKKLLVYCYIRLYIAIL